MRRGYGDNGEGFHAGSRQVLEFVDDHFVFLLQRAVVAGDDVEHEQDFFLAGRGYARGEDVFEDQRHRACGRGGGAANGAEGGFA